MRPGAWLPSRHTAFVIQVLAIAALFLTSACRADTPVAPTAGAIDSRVPSEIAVVSGNDQHGKAGEPLASPFVVRVTDANGNGLGGVAVVFEITSGAGALGGSCRSNPPPLGSSQTDADGIARMSFLPTVLGQTKVIARLAELQGASVTFTAEATVLVIEFWFGYWNVGFVAPCSSSSDVIVRVGTIVEWAIPVTDDRYPVSYTVTSVSAPPGARSFDSGLLTSRERFRFVPPVTGTWEYRDRVTGLTGKLSAR